MDKPGGSSNRSQCPLWRRHQRVAKYEPKLARDRWRRRRARAACLVRRQRKSRSSSEIRPAQHNAASKPPMVQITGQHARIAALSMLTASNRDYPRSTDVARISRRTGSVALAVKHVLLDGFVLLRPQDRRSVVQRIAAPACYLCPCRET